MNGPLHFVWPARIGSILLLIIYGTPDSVADQLLAFQDEVGKFGTLLYAGKDWTDPKLGRESMILMAEKVMPQVNAAVSKRANAAE